jgi:hypothetical protein
LQAFIDGIEAAFQAIETGNFLPLLSEIEQAFGNGETGFLLGVLDVLSDV